MELSIEIMRNKYKTARSLFVEYFSKSTYPAREYQSHHAVLNGE